MLGIGEIIRVNRKTVGYSQEELCYGICSVSSLSKIENGEQVPTRGTFEALMQRMGMSAGVYPSFLNDADKEAYELQHDFNEMYAQGNYDKAEEILNKLSAIKGLDKVYDQDILMCRVLIEQRRGLNAADAVKELEKIANFFIKDFSKDFSVEKIRMRALTKTEINLLNALAAAYSRADDDKMAIKIWYELSIYIESKVYDREGFAVVYTKLLHNLARAVGLSGDDEEAVRLCDKGIRDCIRYNRYTYFDNLLYNKGYGLMNLGREEEAHQCIREAYYIRSALGKTHGGRLEAIKKFADEKGIKLL